MQCNFHINIPYQWPCTPWGNHTELSVMLNKRKPKADESNIHKFTKVPKRSHVYKLARTEPLNITFAFFVSNPNAHWSTQMPTFSLADLLLPLPLKCPLHSSPSLSSVYLCDNAAAPPTGPACTVLSVILCKQTHFSMTLHLRKIFQTCKRNTLFLSPCGAGNVAQNSHQLIDRRNWRREEKWGITNLSNSHRRTCYHPHCLSSICHSSSHTLKMLEGGQLGRRRGPPSQQQPVWVNNGLRESKSSALKFYFLNSQILKAFFFIRQSPCAITYRQIMIVVIIIIIIRTIHSICVALFRKEEETWQGHQNNKTSTYDHINK